MFFGWFQAVLDPAFETVKTWNEPWRSVGSIVFKIVRFVLKAFGFTIIFLVCVCIVGLPFAAADLIRSEAAKSPWVRKWYRKIKVAEDLARLRTVASAGLGSGFCFLLFLALWELWEGTWRSIFGALSTIALVSIGMVMFVEPLTEWIFERIGLETEQAILKRDQRWYLRAGAAGILSAVSLAHGLLHEKINNGRWDSVDALFWALLIPALITCAWIIGAKSSQWAAAWLGTLTGIVLGIGLPLFVVWIFSVNDVNPWIIVENGCKWGMAGFFGGVAIEHSLKRNYIHWIAVAIIGAFFLVSLYVNEDLAYVLRDLSIAIGWAGGLLVVEPLARHCLRLTPRTTFEKAPAFG